MNHVSILLAAERRVKAILKRQEGEFQTCWTIRNAIRVIVLPGWE